MLGCMETLFDLLNDRLVHQGQNTCISVLIYVQIYVTLRKALVTLKTEHSKHFDLTHKGVVMEYYPVIFSHSTMHLDVSVGLSPDNYKL